jgi:hypothetical protein
LQPKFHLLDTGFDDAAHLDLSAIYLQAFAGSGEMA